MWQNVRKITLVNAAYDAIFFIGVTVPFFFENGLTIGQTFLLQGIFAAATAVLEIPSGYLADRWGRKNVIIVGAIAGILGLTVYSGGTGFAMFVVAELLLAVLVSFHSGAVDALLYDTILESSDEAAYRRIRGHVGFVGFATQAVASVIGSALVLISIRFTIALSIIPFVFGLLVALTLEEPKRHKLQQPKHVNELWRIVHYVFAGRPALRNVILLFGTLSSLTLALMWFSQPYQHMLNIPLWLFGAIHGAMMISSGFASKIAHRLERRVNDRWLLVAIACVTIACFLLLGLPITFLGLLFFGLGRSMWGFNAPVSSHIVHRMTTSDIRATVGSIQSFVQRVIFALAAPGLAYLVEAVPLNQAITLAGIAGAVVIILVLLLASKTWNEIPT